MKTAVELPDELVRDVKVRAAEVVRRGLAEPPARTHPTPSRVQLPLVQCSHPATPDLEVTPERAAQILLTAEVRAEGTTDESLR